MWHVYILECEDGYLYTGVTQNLERRFQEHISARGARFTKCSQPKSIIYSEVFGTEILARQRESQIKRWSRAKKQALAEGKLERLRELSMSKD